MKAKYYLRGMGIGVFVTALIFGIALVFYRPKMSEDEIRREAAKLGMVNAADEALLAAAAEEDAPEADTAEKVTVENLPGDTVEEDAPDPEAAGEEADASGEESTDGTSESANDTDSSAEDKDKKADVEESDADDTKPSTEYQGEQKKKDTAASGNDAAGSQASSGSASSSTAGSSGSANSTSGSAGSQTSGSTSGNTGSSSGSAGSSSSGTSYGAASSSAGSKTLTIRTGENSYTTAAHLFKDGLVDNASKFNNYLESNHYDVRIQAGTFTIPEGASYDEIVKIITRQ